MEQQWYSRGVSWPPGGWLLSSSMEGRHRGTVRAGCEEGEATGTWQQLRSGSCRGQALKEFGMFPGHQAPLPWCLRTPSPTTFHIDSPEPNKKAQAQGQGSPWSSPQDADARAERGSVSHHSNQVEEQGSCPNQDPRALTHAQGHSLLFSRSIMGSGCVSEKWSGDQCGDLVVGGQKSSPATTHRMTLDLHRLHPCASLSPRSFGTPNTSMSANPTPSP